MSATPRGDVTLTPNHHADHPGFAGIGGVVAAICFTIGRGAAADLAIERPAGRRRSSASTLRP
jgi:hypothetical protein